MMIVFLDQKVRVDGTVGLAYLMGARITKQLKEGQSILAELQNKNHVEIY
jgi:hypothetical protein